jgi:large subunit ribosomal protein L2
MALKSFNPYTASRRFITMLDKSEVTKQTPEKSLVESKKRTGGRNSHGDITSWHRGGGHKRQYRQVDFRREKTASRRAWRPSNTTRIARRAWRCCTTPTARSVTSCTQLAWKWA